MAGSLSYMLASPESHPDVKSFVCPKGPFSYILYADVICPRGTA